MSFADRLAQLESFVLSDERFESTDSVEYKSVPPGGVGGAYQALADCYVSEATADESKRYGRHGKRYPIILEVLSANLASVNLGFDRVRFEAEEYTVVGELDSPAGLRRLYCA